MNILFDVSNIICMAGTYCTYGGCPNIWYASYDTAVSKHGQNPAQQIPNLSCGVWAKFEPELQVADVLLLAAGRLEAVASQMSEYN